LNNYICGQLSNGIKFQVALEIIDLSIRIGDKVLLFRYDKPLFFVLLEFDEYIWNFSQSLLALNKLEEFLNLRQIPNTEQKWEKNVNYYSKSKLFIDQFSFYSI